METPYIFIDESIMSSNIEKMTKTIIASGCKHRPHTKTHKSIEIAKLQLKAGADGITVAKMGEAEVMASGGIDDIFMAYPIIGKNKIKRAIDLSSKIKRLILTVESLYGAKKLSEKAIKADCILEVRLEVDTGMKRTGVMLDDAKALAKKILDLPGLKLTGLFTFKGGIYKGKPTTDFEAAGIEEAELLLNLKNKMKRYGDFEVSGGSTPTGIYTARVSGVDEVRPGTYVFNDSSQAANGVCSVDDCALEIVYTVVSVQEKGRMVIDGGSKSISTDSQPDKAPTFMKGFGICRNDRHAILERLSEEHGVVRLEDGAKDYKVGDQIAFIPNHVCTAVNLYDKAYIGDKINLRKILIDARGKLI